MPNDTATHAWLCCLHYYSGDKGCRTNFCCCCCQAGDPHANTTYRGKRVTDCNGCGCCGVHSYDITGAPASATPAGAGSAATTAPAAQQMAYTQGGSVAQMGAGGPPATAQGMPANGTPVSNQHLGYSANPYAKKPKAGYEPGPVTG